QTCLSGAIVVLIASQQIERSRNCSESINTNITDSATRFHLTFGLQHLVASHSIGSNQCHETDAARDHPLRVMFLETHRRAPNRFLIFQNVFEEFVLE